MPGVPSGRSFAAMNLLPTSTLRPGDAGYDVARRAHNAMIDRHPLLIARPADTADVVAALALARAENLALAVRSGGHSPFGIAGAGLTLDVRGLDAIAVDPVARTVRVGGGVTSGALDAALARHGLALTGARHASVGVAGFTTGSGSGWLERTMGLAADNLRAATLVTADGQHVVASPDQHPDLFWALRGGGGNFGVVTELEFGTLALGPEVVGGVRLYPAGRLAEVLATYADVMERAPDELCGGMALTCVEGEPVVANVVLWAGAPAEAVLGLAPLARLGEPVADLVGPRPYPELLGPAPPAGPRRRSYLKFGVLDELSAPAIAVLAQLAGELCTPHCAILVSPLGGAFARTGADTALGERGARFAYQVLTAWDDPADDAPNVAWTRAAAAELAEFGRTPPWPNFVTADDPRRLAVPYAPETLARLREVKAAWDPDNVFRANHNIAPA